MFRSEHYTTVSSLADSILSRHFEEYKELLNDAHEKKAREVLAWLKDMGTGRSGEPEKEPEMQSENQPGGLENKVESVE
jgi:hypothetical protein